MTQRHSTNPHLAETSVPQIMRLPIDRIQSYGGNPRRQINPEYDRLKASIRTEGLDQPLVVTQKPGETDYLLQAGGNTRLAILKTLYAETGDARFESVDCLAKPWVEESTVLLAHLRENELRGELTFIDKARAVFEAKRLFETELGVTELSLRRLEQLLKERGFPLGNAVISKMGYAVHTLLSLIPQALSTGLGRPQIEKIRALERAAGSLWTVKELGDQEEFTSIFATLCQRYDTPDWDLEPLRNALENEIAEAAEENLQTIRIALGALLSGRALSNYVSEDTHQTDPSHPAPAPFKKKDTNLSSTEPEATDGTLGDPHQPREKPQAINAPEREMGDSVVPTRTPITVVSDSSAKDISEDINTLRTQAWTLAAQLAQNNGLGDLVIPLSDQGLGYLLRDVPDPVLAETLDPALLGQVSTLWWQLAACAEMTVAPIEALTILLDEHSTLCQALVQQDAGLLFDSVWTLDPGQMGHQLWRQLNDEDWQDLLQLMNIYRQLHRCAVDSGQSLWESES